MSDAERGRVLAVDYGAKRTGLAVSDALRIVAHPVEAVVSEDLDATVARVAEIARDRDVVRVVLGMPYLPDGREGEQVQQVLVFADALRARLPAGTPVEPWDERHTSKEARSLLRKAGVDVRRKRALVDSVAAVVLLRDYLGHPGE